MAIDLGGTWSCREAELTHFLSTGSGSIVTVASGAGLKATRGQPADAARAGVVSLSRQAARAHARNGIRVNAVAPGLIETPAVAVLPDEVRARHETSNPPALSAGRRRGVVPGLSIAGSHPHDRWTWSSAAGRGRGTRGEPPFDSHRAERVSEWA